MFRRKLDKLIFIINITAEKEKKEKEVQAEFKRRKIVLEK